MPVPLVPVPPEVDPPLVDPPLVDPPLVVPPLVPLVVPPELVPLVVPPLELDPIDPLRPIDAFRKTNRSPPLVPLDVPLDADPVVPLVDPDVPVVPDVAPPMSSARARQPVTVIVPLLACVPLVLDPDDCAEVPPPHASATTAMPPIHALFISLPSCELPCSFTRLEGNNAATLMPTTKSRASRARVKAMWARALGERRVTT
jgi:hypothetical protein